MAERPSLPPPSSNEVAGEDFLFHLYRGSELLQEDRVAEAKGELETALSRSPSDAKSQHLLGIVYFRLGLYPHAIAIYERLVRLHPASVEPRVNLALSYLKTGQPALARVELERVVELSPTHARAWGYLGLACQRLGDVGRARDAFSRGGYEHMARRLEDPTQPAPTFTIPPDAPSHLSHELRLAASDATARLDLPDSGFHAAPTELRGAPSAAGMWASIELGREPMPSLPSFGTPFREGGDGFSTAWTASGTPSAAPLPAETPTPSPARWTVIPLANKRQGSSAPTTADALCRESLLALHGDIPVLLHKNGAVLVRSEERFAARLGLVRASRSSPDATFTQLERRARGRTLGEPFGGTLAPMFEVSGSCELVLGPPTGLTLRPVTLSDQPLCLREDAIAAFALTLAYESGKLALGNGEATRMVLLRGEGVAVLALPRNTATVEVTEARELVARAASVVGWLGQIHPRALATSEAPAHARGYVSLAGDGMVLLDVD